MNIVSIYDYFQTEIHFYIVYLYFEGANLIDYYIKHAKDMNEAKIKMIVKQLAVILQFLHERNIMLRKFDVSNVLFDGSSVHLIGFENAVIIKEDYLVKAKNLKYSRSFTNTSYMAPEIIKSSHDQRADIWALGVIMHMLLTGSLPFSGNKTEEIFHNTLTSPLNVKLLTHVNISDEAISLITGMLEKDPNKRISLAGVIQSRWFDLPEVVLSKRDSIEILKM